jgi:predicted nucleic acid-binding Zn ribbon protein
MTIRMCHCPYCNAAMSPDHPFGGKPMNPNTVTSCSRCGELLVYDGKGLFSLTENERSFLMRLNPEAFKQVSDRGESRRTAYLEAKKNSFERSLK